MPLQQGRTGGRWAGLRGHRSVRGAAVGWRTGACAQAGDVSTGPYQKRVYTEGQWQTQAIGHLDVACIMHLMQGGLGIMEEDGMSGQPISGVFDPMRHRS